MAANKPTEFILPDDDAMFFYHNIFASYLKNTSQRVKIKQIASKYNIKIDFKEFGKCKRFKPFADTICIYCKYNDQNKQFIQHLRNAFAHGHIEIDNHRCRVLDWNPYGEPKKGKQPFKAHLITMNGDVSYQDFKQMLEEFSSDKSLITNTKKTKRRNMKYLKQLIALVVLLASVNTIKAYDFEYEGIAYYVLSTSEMTCGVAPKEGGYAGEITIPETVEYMGHTLTVVRLSAGCFKDCSQLTKVNLPNSLAYIGNECFKNCTSLKSIDISHIKHLLSRCAFQGCSALTMVELPKRFPSLLDDYCFADCVSLKEIELPEDVSGLGDYCFANCKSLTSIALPSLPEIGTCCFSGCTSLTSLTPGIYGERVGTAFIAGCTSLKTLTYFGPLVEEALRGSSVTSLTLIGTDFLYPEFFKYVKLKELIIKDGDEPFRLPKRSKWDSTDGFNININLDSLESIYIGRECEEEGYYYSSICIPEVKYITFGANITDLDHDGIGIYSGCENLVRIQCNSTIPPSFEYYINSMQFSTKQYMNVEVCVPDEAVDAYKKHEDWKAFWNIKGISQSSGVDDIAADNSDKVEIGRYDTLGRPVTENYNGIIIIRYSDGSTEKIYHVQ